MDQPIQFTDRLKIKGFILNQEILIQGRDNFITCQIQTSQFQKFPIKLYAQNIQTTNTLIKLHNFVADPTKNQNNKNLIKDYPIYIFDSKTKAEYQPFLNKYYKCIFNEGQKILNLYVKQGLNINLSFCSVDRPKFAKTSKLQKILSGQDNEQQGILTMDQSGRFMIQKNDCKFPAIGIWHQTDNLYQTMTHLKICSFLKKKPTKNFSKFMIGINNKNYIAFAKISKNQIPQLYFVSWKLEKRQQTQQIITQYHINSQKQLQLQFNKQNLQFTLRGQRNQKISPFSSPKKSMTNEQLQYQLQRIHQQQSPQFSSIKKHNQWPFWQQQKAMLTQKIQSQQQQIERLNNQVQKLTNQLYSLRKCVTSPPQKHLANFKSPLLMPESSTPAQKIKKLSESDLQTSNLKSFASGSTKQKKSIQNQSMNGSNSFENKKQQIPYDQDPWDMMQIIE